MLIYVLLGLAVLIVVFLFVAAQQPNELSVKRSITVLAPAAFAFAEVNDLSNWQVISPYAKEDPAAKYTLSESTVGVGSSIEWSGNSKVGAGRITIGESRPNELVRYNFEFFKPWYCTNTTDFILRPVASGTEVTWAMSMRNNFVAKASGLLMNMDKLMGESFEAGLVNLKNLAEEAARKN
jgi:Polyketide cyclase / dehydrase and lipid transport